MLSPISSNLQSIQVNLVDVQVDLQSQAPAVVAVPPPHPAAQLQAPALAAPAVAAPVAAAPVAQAQQARHSSTPVEVLVKGSFGRRGTRNRWRKDMKRHKCGEWKGWTSAIIASYHPLETAVVSEPKPNSSRIGKPKVSEKKMCKGRKPKDPALYAQIYRMQWISAPLSCASQLVRLRRDVKSHSWSFLDGGFISFNTLLI